MSGPSIPGSVPPPPPPPEPTEGSAATASHPVTAQNAPARDVPSHDDAPTAPFTPFPAAPTQHAPVPPPPDAPATTPAVPLSASSAPLSAPAPAAAAPVRRTSVAAATQHHAPAAPAAPSSPPASVPRVSAAQRLPRSAVPASPYAAAAPQPAPPMPRAGIPLQHVTTPEPGDWFGEAVAEQANAARTAPQAGQASAPSYPPQQYAHAAPHAAVYPPAGSAPTGYADPGYAEDAPGRARRRLSPGWVAFIALDVVLLVAAAVFAWNMISGDRPVDRADGSTSAISQETASPDASEAPPAETLATFASKTGNITCTITTAEVSCGIAQLNQQPAPVDGCDGTVGYRVTISAATGEVSLPCVPADQQPKAATPDMTVLEYTASLTEGQFTCLSEDTGMSCKDDKTGKGFKIAKAGIGTF